MKFLPVGFYALLVVGSGSLFAATTLTLEVDPAAGGAAEFAAAEIRREAAARKITVARDPASAPRDAIRIALIVAAPAPAATSAVPQSYAIRVQRNRGRAAIVVRGADAAGVMYGGLDVAEAIRTGTLDTITDSDHAPHIAQRGIKFNIPLDLRTPSYTDPSHAAQANIPEVWSREFWREFLDDLARHRYNVLTLWSLHPFPSIVKVPEFPNVALDDVWRTTAKLEADFDFNGNNFVRPEMLAQHEVVKRLTIDEKIQFWRDVMQLAKDRGVDVYWFTWNIFLHGAAGKDGLTEDKGAPRTIAYFRASVRETIKTYPLLAGFGITAGESMPVKIGGLSKEQWLWQTYGEGIRDALKEDPQRKFRLIHRFHMTGLGEIQKEFAELPCPMDLSFKYAIAHMYSIPNPPMITPVLPLLGPQLRSWLTVRNDDIYSFRWADVDYARAFIKAIPPADKVAGFYMGTDGYLWGRDFLSKDPGSPRQTVMQKQWLSFALWGRLAYAPDLPAAVFQRLTGARFPGADVPALTAAWADASKTFPYITRFFWGDIDLKWLPEACLSSPRFRGYYTVRHFIEGSTMPGSGVMNIIDWRKRRLAGQPMEGVTPVDIAATLETNARRALAALPRLRANATSVGNAREYGATLGDIESMALLGLYYAAKIRGACELALYDRNGDTARKADAVGHLEAALQHWKDYAASYTRQSVQPVLYNRVGWVDIPKLVENANADVKIACDWEPGTIVESAIKRSGTEAGFRK